MRELRASLAALHNVHRRVSAEYALWDSADFDYEKEFAAADAEAERISKEDFERAMAEARAEAEAEVARAAAEARGGEDGD